jgi:hypothetical protein
MAQEGLISVASRYSAAETMQRLLSALAKRDMAVFAASITPPMPPPSAFLCSRRK